MSSRDFSDYNVTAWLLMKGSSSEFIVSHNKTIKELEKVKETDLRERETNLRQNAYWLSALYSYDYNGWDLKDILRYEEMVKGLTAETIRDAARRYLDTNNYARFTLLPEKTGE